MAGSIVLSLTANRALHSTLVPIGLVLSLLDMLLLGERVLSGE